MSYFDVALESDHGKAKTTDDENSFTTPDKPTILLVDSPGAKSKSATFQTAAPAPVLEKIHVHAPGQPPKFDGVEIKDTYKRRRCGVFANRYLGRGELILAEHPLLSCGRQHTSKGEKWPVAGEWCKLPEDDQLELRNRFRKLRSIPIGTARLGWYWQRKIKDFFIEYAFSNPQRNKGHVYAVGSHINHACMSCANVEQWTESAFPHRILVRVVRPVRPNEEVLIYYNSRRGASLTCPNCGSKGLRDRLGDFCRIISRVVSWTKKSGK
ncbi:hypothetical protein ACQKWADRAFT_276977 [Trichoderma austrokoningii]